MWGQQERKRTDSNLTMDALAHFANFKLAGDRAVRDVSETLSSFGSSSPSTASMGRSATSNNVSGNRPRRRRRRGTYARRRLSSRRIGALSDADLEAELASRRQQRARERDRYARAMRSEKLQVLEMELNNLRSKIGTTAARTGNSGTPPNPRWESLNARRHSGDRAPSLNSSALKRGSNPPGTPAPGHGHGPPPPPPLGGLRDPNDDEGEAPIDPEVQKREKAERQRRREAKRKEREANKKPMTLAEIIKSAGKNPISRLKPKGAIATVDVDDPNPEPVAEMVQVTLKKVEKKEEEKPKEEESELSKAMKKAGASPQEKEDEAAKKDEKKDGANDEEGKEETKKDVEKDQVDTAANGESKDDSKVEGATDEKGKAAKGEAAPGTKAEGTKKDDGKSEKKDETKEETATQAKEEAEQKKKNETGKGAETKDATAQKTNSKKEGKGTKKKGGLDMAEMMKTMKKIESSKKTKDGDSSANLVTELSAPAPGVASESNKSPATTTTA